MANTLFSRRPIDEVTLGDLLMWRAKAMAGEWSRYTVAEINAECDRRMRKSRIVFDKSERT